MGRPRTATAVLDARGAFKKHPERKRQAEPETKAPFPDKPPAKLSAEEKKHWRNIVKIAPAGVLTGADAYSVQMLARLVAEMEEDFRAMPAARLVRLDSLLGKLGLSPSGRAGLIVDKPKKNDFDDV